MAFPFGRKEIDAPKVEDGELPLHKILYAYEMRKDCARECIATGGEIDREGKDEGKAAKRVCESPEYGRPRKKLKMK